MPVRIYDISKKLGLENKDILVKAKALGIAAAKVPSSSLDKISAEYLEEELIKDRPELAARLTGWEVDIDAEHVVAKGFNEKVAEAVASIAAIPGVTREQADALVHAGLTRIEDLLSAEAGDIADIPQIGDHAAAILASAHAEAERRTLTLGGAPVNP